MKRLKEKYIGDKKFYQKILLIAIPIMIQNGITNFVGLLDNVMVGRIGTDQMNAVAIVNQLLFVFNLCVWGGVSGAGIFTAQYYGKGDQAGVRDTFRAKLLLSGGILFMGVLVFLWKGEYLITSFLHETNGIGDAQATLQYAKEYLLIMLIGLIPFVISQSYSNTLRDIGQTVLPMVAGVIAVFVNLILNFILIFGYLGAPKLGVAGAAIATVVSRFVETGVVVIWTHSRPRLNEFIVGAYRTMKIPTSLMKQIVIKGTPLAVNEAMWALGMTMLNQSYSLRGLDVVGAFNISSTITNLFNVVFIAMGDSIAIVVGQLLGAGKMKEAKDTDRKMIFFSVASCVVIAFIMSCLKDIFPMAYKTEPQVRELAGSLILIGSVFMPAWAFLHGCYFTLRTGGKTGITFLFDSGFVWVLELPVIYILARYTGLSIIAIYICAQCIELIKCLIGFILVKKGIWLQNIVKDT